MAVLKRGDSSAL